MNNTPTNMTELFTKLDDLKSVFRYGERLIPIVQSLIDFMRDTVPLLEKINTSISDSTSKIPKAADQINNVTNATELATTEILDLVDIITGDVILIEKALDRLLSNETERKQLEERIIEKFSGDTRAIELFNKYVALAEVKLNVEPVLNLFEKIRMDAYNITMSLQVQDITTQQLAAVNHLIVSVQDKLASLLYNFQESDLKGNGKSGITQIDEGTFNADARYEKGNHNQEVADSLMNTGTFATQDEIDKLFS